MKFKVSSLGTFFLPAVILALAVTFSAGLAGQAAPARIEPVRSRAVPVAFDEIRTDRIAAHVKFLAHDLLEGRAPATRGGDLAAEYIAAQFQLLGLEPGAPDGTYFQQVPILESTIDPVFTLQARGKQGEQVYRYGSDVVAFSDLNDQRVEARGDVVFVGHGIVAPEYRWNDYEGADVKDRIVLIMVNDPPATADEPDLFAGKALTYYGRWTYKYEEAARQGAAGAILIHTTESATYPWQVVESSWTGAQYSLPPAPGQPALGLKAWITDEGARRLATLGGHDLDELRKQALGREFRPVPLHVQVAATLQQQVTERQSPNVIGLLTGSRPEEAVVYTAHYDHLGMREEPDGSVVIYNGARDNASGVGGILQIAQAFVRGGDRPERSIYFLATTAEESGLLGSEYFAANPPIPIERFAANLNVDSLNIWGRTQGIVLLGAERSTLGPTIAQLAEERGRTSQPDPYPDRGYFFRSDHFPLAKAGVPAVSYSDSTDFVGEGADRARRLQQEHSKKHYHQPTDEYGPDWDLSGAVEDLRFLADLGWRLAETVEMPRYHEDDQFARPRLTR
jgi:Zn-dependent M28 family amino/carboxypeptidase